MDSFHRMPWLCRALWVLLTLSAAPTVRAGIADAPGQNLQIALITYGPGTVYWERFGHDAIEVRDRISGEALNFNYGIFDFAQKNFLLNFARGRMRYMMDAAPSSPEIAGYIQQGRSVRRQVLALKPAQAARLRDYLLWNLQPAHLHYDYDYFTDNCATRVRDVIDRVTDGALKAQLTRHRGRYTYRQQTDRLMAGQPWLMLLLDLGLGPFADQPLNRWHDSFIPMTLEANLRQVSVADRHGARHPLLAREQLLTPGHLPPPPSQPPDLRLPLAAAGLLWAALLYLADRRRRRGARLGFGLGASAFLLLAGVAGVFMTALWAFSAHRAAWANANLLLFNPLALALLPAVCKRRTPGWAHALAWALTATAAAMLVAHLCGLLSQRNLPWIFLALPIWLVLLNSLRRRSG